MSNYFDYQALAKKAGLDAKMLKELEDCVREQHVSDDMMFELRMLRTLSAIDEGVITLKEALLEFETEEPVKIAA